MTELERQNPRNFIDYNQNREDVIILRRRFVAARRLKNISYDDIMEEWNGQEGMPATWRVNRIQTLGQDYKVIMKELAESTLQEAALIRESRRLFLERLLHKLEPKIEMGDTRAIDSAVRIEARLAAMYGFDMPIKVAQTDSSGRDILQMSDEERFERLEMLLRKAEERRRIEEGEPEDESGDAFADDPEPEV
jgi:hypothetical protein